jgi:hypothetical protein
MIEDLVQGRKYGAVTTRINSLHNTFAPNPEGLRKWLETMDPDERAMRERGEWVDRRGAIYPQWSRSAHYVTASEALAGYDPGTDGEGNPLPPLTSIPRHWPRFRAWDFGHNTAVTWGAVAPDGIVHLYRCMRAAGVPIPEWAELCHQAEGAVRDDHGVWVGHTESIELGWGDPSDPEAIEQLCMLDVPTVKAHRKVDLGIGAVKDAMRFRADGRPGLYVHSDGEGTAMLVEEWEAYKWDPNSKTPKPLKVRDHLADTARYLIYGAMLYEGRAPVERAATQTEEEREAERKARAYDG